MCSPQTDQTLTCSCYRICMYTNMCMQEIMYQLGGGLHHFWVPLGGSNIFGYILGWSTSFTCGLSYCTPTHSIINERSVNYFPPFISGWGLWYIVDPGNGLNKIWQYCKNVEKCVNN